MFLNNLNVCERKIVLSLNKDNTQTGSKQSRFLLKDKEKGKQGNTTLKVFSSYTEHNVSVPLKWDRFSPIHSAEKRSNQRNMEEAFIYGNFIYFITRQTQSVIWFFVACRWRKMPGTAKWNTLSEMKSHNIVPILIICSSLNDPLPFPLTLSLIHSIPGYEIILTHFSTNKWLMSTFNAKENISREMEKYRIELNLPSLHPCWIYSEIFPFFPIPFHPILFHSVINFLFTLLLFYFFSFLLKDYL